MFRIPSWSSILVPPICWGMDRSRSGSRQQERQMEIEDHFTMERRSHPYPVSFRKRLSARAEVREEAAMSSSQVPLPADRPAPEHSPSHYRGYVPSLSYHEFRNSHGSSSSSSDSLEHAWSATVPEAVENGLPSRYHLQEQVASGTDELERCSVGEISDNGYPESDWSSTNVSADAARMMMERVKLVSALSEEKTYSFPGLCRKDNNWTLRTAGSCLATPRLVRDLLYKYVLRTEDDEADLEVAELFRVSAVLSRTGGPAPEGYSLEECATLDEDSKIGKVRLLFGEKVWSRRIR